MGGIIVTSENRQRNNLIALTILIIFQLIFYALEMQLGSLMNLFAERNVSKTILGYVLPASIYQAINPFSIIIFGGLIGAYNKPRKNTQLISFGLGLFTMALCFYILWFGCLNADETGNTHYLYLIVGLSFMGIGEILVAPYIYSQATILAPTNLKGFVMGIVLLSMAYANLAGPIIAKFMAVPHVDGVFDPFQSLAIYKAGFLQIANFNVLIVIIFSVFTLWLRKLTKD